MLATVVQRLASNAISAAKLTHWRFSESLFSPGGAPPWSTATECMRGGLRWQHTCPGVSTGRSAIYGSAAPLQQQLTQQRRPCMPGAPSAGTWPCSDQQQRLQSRTAATSANAASVATGSAAAGPEALQLQSVPKPWTPTDQLRKRKILPKRMGHLLAELEKEQVQQAMASRSLPQFGPGDNLQLKLSVPENRRRVAIVQGICIAKRNRGWRTSFTIRNHIGTAGGFERTFPLFSPNIQEIVVLDSKKVRRAKLYYLRDRQPREYRVAHGDAMKSRS